MDAKDLRTEAALGDRSNDGNTKYVQGGGAVPYHRNKTYQDIGSNSLGKVDVSAARPCAVIGPDRVMPPSVSAEPYLKKGAVEPWHSTDLYRRPPEYPHKILDYQHPTRNISPRQTFQENMQRIMVAPTYNSMKSKEDLSFPDSSISQMRINKLNVTADSNPKYCDVPYNINVTNDQKNARNPDPNNSAVNVNSAVTRSAPSNWPPASANIRPAKPYPQDLYQYPDYSSCAGPKPMIIPRSHRNLHEEPGPVYPDGYYHEGNIRFKPYPTSKERYPQPRYEYIGNYSNPFHPPPPFPSHKYDMQKQMPPRPYPGYPQVPFKYLDGRIVEPVLNGYQRPVNQPPNYNMPYRNQVIHPSYGSVPGNCLPTNKLYPYHPDNAKSLSSNKLPYDTNGKIYPEFENNRLKGFPVPEGFYVNEIGRPQPMKGQVLPPSYPTNVHAMHHPYYRKDSIPIRGYEYNHHFRNLDPSLNVNANPLSRLPSQFSPTAIAISPSDSMTNIDNQNQVSTQEDCGYVSQTSTASARSIDYGINRFPPELYKRYYDPKYSHLGKIQHVMPKYESNQINDEGSKDKKNIDVRQFLQMWNEGEDENGENNNKDGIAKTTSNNINNNANRHENSSQEQLYVLGLVNVPSEELSKYEHIQKVSKLPENIKGYNSIELLHQFEEVIESSNLNNLNAKPSLQRDFHTTLKGAISMHGISIPSRPLSPLDVEAKISQSVIHKEVGCNFEIKPCSPKMLNVEAAQSMQSVFTERVIEKVSNPLMVESPVMQDINEIRDNCSIIQLQDRTSESPKIACCKMTNKQYNANDSVDSIKTNYSLQDLESNSGVCLASLPRLDNDIELNFPEVNQQFINANKVESTIISQPLKDLPTLDTEQSGPTESKKDKESAVSNKHTDKDLSKLSKYRKLKRKSLEHHSSSSESSLQALRTDSVIIKNPDNIKNHENISDNSSKVTSEGAQCNPINLSVTMDHSRDSKQSDKSDFSVNKSLEGVFSDSAIDFSLNSVDQFENNDEKAVTSNNDDENKTNDNHENAPKGNDEIAPSEENILSTPIVEHSLGKESNFVEHSSDNCYKNPDFLELSKQSDILETNGNERDTGDLETDLNFTVTIKNSDSKFVDPQYSTENSTININKCEDDAELQDSNEGDGNSLLHTLPGDQNKGTTDISTVKEVSEPQHFSSSSPDPEEEEVRKIEVIENETLKDINSELDDQSIGEKHTKINELKSEVSLPTSELDDVSKDVSNAELSETNVRRDDEIKMETSEATGIFESNHGNKLVTQMSIETLLTKDIQFRKELWSPWIQKLCIHREGVIKNEKNDAICKYKEHFDEQVRDIAENEKVGPLADSEDFSYLTIQHSNEEISEDINIKQCLQADRTESIGDCTDLQNKNKAESVSERNDEQKLCFDYQDTNSNVNEFENPSLTVSLVNETSKEETDGTYTNTSHDNHENFPKVEENENSSVSITKSDFIAEYDISTNDSTTTDENENSSDSSSSSDDEDSELDDKSDSNLSHDSETILKDVEVSSNCNTYELARDISRESLQVTKNVIDQDENKTELVEKGPPENKEVNVDRDVDPAANNSTASKESTDNIFVLAGNRVEDNLICKRIHDVEESKSSYSEVNISDNKLKDDSCAKISEQNCEEIQGSLEETRSTEFEKDNCSDLSTPNINNCNDSSLRLLESNEVNHEINCMALQKEIEKGTKVVIGDINDELSEDSTFGSPQMQEEHNEREIVETCYVDEEQNDRSVQQDFALKFNKMRSSLKRSYSDSALDNIRETIKEDSEKTCFLRPNKLRKIVEPEHLLHESYCNIIQNYRRNSVSSIQNAENVSFCILIDNDCIITEDDEEDDKICFAEMPENCLSTCIQDHVSDGEAVAEMLTFQEDINCDNAYSQAEDELEEETLVEPWVEDVACVETVVADDIAENIVISASASPKNGTFSDDECDDDDAQLYNTNEHTDKLKYIYGDKMCRDDSHFVETLYRTPQMNVDKTLNNRESQALDENTKYYDKESLEKVLSESNAIYGTSCSLTEFDFTSDPRIVPSPTISTPGNTDQHESSPRSLDLENVVKDKNEKDENGTFEAQKYKKVFDENSKSGVLGLCESSIDEDITCTKSDESSKYTISSSPEVSSTTSEERNSGIFLKISNYGGSIISQVRDVNPVNRICCKYTENKEYLSSNNNLPTRTLITKAAQKYIPPLKESIPDLKIKLRLPEHRLTKLKQLKIAKESVTPNVNKNNNILLIKKEIPKKSKPKFEDVLKSLDEMQFQKHKIKLKDKKIRKIPKVVIKKNENGSHYASTSNRDTFNPDLTGRKWQPWVFLEKNVFIDKMAIRRKTRAIFSHRKNTYVLAEKFQKYKSVENPKFIISHPKSNSSGHLKYTFKLKQNY